MPAPHTTCADRMAGFALSCFPKKIDIPVALRDQPFGGCQMSSRLADVLRRSGIRVLGELQGRTVGDFARQKNCGFKTLHEWAGIYCVKRIGPSNTTSSPRTAHLFYRGRFVLRSLATRLEAKNARR